METRILHFDSSYAHYAQAGTQGPAIIILHGWAASLKQWEWLLPNLANAGYTAYALDLVGHGRAPRLSHDHTFEDYLSYLCHWIKSLEIQHPIFLGHSMGGYLSLKYTLDHPASVRGLVLVDPLYSYHQFDSYHQFARRLLSKPEMLRIGEFLFRIVPDWLIEATYYLGLPDVGNAPGALRRQLTLDHNRADPRILQTLSGIGDLGSCLEQVRVPALVAWGCRDHLLSPASFERLVDLLPIARGYGFSDVGHHPHLACTQSFTDLVLGFLRQLEEDHHEAEAASTEVNRLWVSNSTSVPADR